jgi:uncharacterized protein with PIN domain
MARRAVREGQPRAIFVPNELPPVDQVRLTFRELRLTLRPSRCMACGGAIEAVDRESVRDEAPPRTFAVVDRFQRCTRCGLLLWKGTHWENIEALRRRVVEPATDAGIRGDSAGKTEPDASPHR